MRNYSKAYLVKDFRAFDGWREPERDEALEDSDILYLQDNFIVVEDCFEENSIIFDDLTDEWKAFCKDTLHFEIPEDLRYAYEDDAAAPAAGTDSEASADASAG